MPVSVNITNALMIRKSQTQICLSIRQFFSVHCAFAHFKPVLVMSCSLLLTLEGQQPGVASSLLTLRLVFCGHSVIKLPVEDL